MKSEVRELPREGTKQKNTRMGIFCNALEILCVWGFLNYLPGFLGGIHDAVDFHIFFVDGCKLSTNIRLHPFKEGSPEFAADTNDGDVAESLFGLNKSDHLKKFVQGSETSREIDIGLGGISEHNLPAEKVVKADALFNPGVDALFKGELDIESDRFSAALMDSAVTGFHYARTAARDYPISFFSQYLAQALGLFVPMIIFRETRGAEKTNGFNFIEVREEGEAVRKFGKNAENPPVKGVPEISVRFRLRRQLGGREVYSVLFVSGRYQSHFVFWQSLVFVSAFCLILAYFEEREFVL